MTNRTPAPWNDNDAYGNIWHEDAGCRTAVVEGSGNGLVINNPYDRDLILAAPDMYEALQKIHGLLGALGEEGLVIYEWAGEALKKARGEA